MSYVVDQSLAEFGRSIGIDGLTFNEHGVVSLKFELLGGLYLEKAESDCVLVYLVRELDRPSREIFAAALDLCHWRHNHPFAVNASLRDDANLVFSVKLTQEEFSVPTLEQLLQFLGHVHDQAREGVIA